MPRHHKYERLFIIFQSHLIDVLWVDFDVENFCVDAVAMLDENINNYQRRER